jgi:hypothetical protein
LVVILCMEMSFMVGDRLGKKGAFDGWDICVNVWET